MQIHFWAEHRHYSTGFGKWKPQDVKCPHWHTEDPFEPTDAPVVLVLIGLQ